MVQAGRKHIDLSYLAGYFDGEGCICYSAETNGVRVEVTNTYPLVLEEFMVRFGGSIYRPDGRRVKGPKYRPCWRWYVCGEKALVFLAAMKEHLVEKSPQARLVLDRRASGMAKADRESLESDLKLMKRLFHDHDEHHAAD